MADAGVSRVACSGGVYVARRPVDFRLRFRRCLWLLRAGRVPAVISAYVAGGAVFLVATVVVIASSAAEGVAAARTGSHLWSTEMGR